MLDSSKDYVKSNFIDSFAWPGVSDAGECPMSAAVNRILVVDDDTTLIGEYMRCLGEDFEPDIGATTLTDLEKVLLGEDTDERGAARFEVHTRNQGEAAVAAVALAVTLDRASTSRPSGPSTLMM